MPIIGVAGRPWTIEQLRAHVHDSLEETGGVDTAAFEKLCSLLQYVSGDYHNTETYSKIRKALGSAQRPLHYLAIPPSMFGPVVEGLGQSGSARDARVIVEKPFGRDLASARELNRMLLRVFRESQIFRIDHYLGKETVQNILVFRFANGIFEPIWNQHYVDHVQITVAESIGVEGRAGYYETAGVVRDIIQSHMMQLLTLMAMESPVAIDPRIAPVSPVGPRTRRRETQARGSGSIETIGLNHLAGMGCCPKPARRTLLPVTRRGLKARPRPSRGERT